MHCCEICPKDFFRRKPVVSWNCMETRLSNVTKVQLPPNNSMIYCTRIEPRLPRDDWLICHSNLCKNEMHPKPLRNARTRCFIKWWFYMILGLMRGHSEKAIIKCNTKHNGRNFEWNLFAFERFYAGAQYFLLLKKVLCPNSAQRQIVRTPLETRKDAKRLAVTVASTFRCNLFSGALLSDLLTSSPTVSSQLLLKSCFQSGWHLPCLDSGRELFCHVNEFSKPVQLMLFP